MTWQEYDLAMMAIQRDDPVAAREHLQRAGEDGRALLALGQLADNAGKPEFYERAAALGNGEAAYNLGAWHARHDDYPAALRWYERAAELGDKSARRMIGIMYATGQGVTVDNDVAEAHWRAAAAAGDTRALHDLGTMFAHHRVDLAEAAHWYLEAAREGFEPANRELALLAPRLSEATTRTRTMRGVILAFVLGEPAEGARLLAVSAAQNDPIAQRSYAFLLHHGTGVEEDREQAAALCRAAAEAGDAWAALNVASILGDHPDAVRWLRAAAEDGVRAAYPVLGDRLSALDEDDEALSWYVRAAEGGHQGAMRAAADWYRDGYGGPVDLVQALRWYLKLLDVGSGDGIHAAHAIVPRMTVDEIHEAGRYTEADVFAQRKAP
ncbi:tetratricopeptide repeat protein [Actinoplanes sp. HUAS TT8]|uniref:tetratricopeptide repeat protein n=1 Tax=Actinoplanes sp. HUAS TT8 TaxID=3447453 RepID=UPI003F526890